MDNYLDSEFLAYHFADKEKKSEFHTEHYTKVLKHM